MATFVKQRPNYLQKILDVTRDELLNAQIFASLRAAKALGDEFRIS